MATIDKKHCSVADAAEIIGCSDSRVRQLLRAGELRGIKVNERAWVVEVNDAKRVAKIEHTVGGPRGPRLSNGA